MKDLVLLIVLVSQSKRIIIQMILTSQQVQAMLFEEKP